MPLYEYQCESCEHRFERIQKFSDPPVDTCPKCGGAVKKLFSSPAIQFKGSGWYITDYAKKSTGAPKSSGGKEPSGASESGGAAPAKESKESKESKDSAPAPSKTSKTKDE